MVYGPTLTKLLAESRLPELGPGRVDSRRHGELKVEISKAISEAGTIQNQDLAE